MTPEEIVRGGAQGLFALPELAVKIHELVERKAPASDIAAALSLEPFMTARLLKLANSPLYRLQGKVDSVSRAITIIGSKGIRDLVVSFTVVEEFFQKGTGGAADCIDIRAFWECSTGCAVLAQELGQTCGLSYTEPLLIAGLLHDIGHIVLAEKLPDVSREIYRQARSQGQPLEEVERQLLGFSHADVAAALLDSWNFPMVLIEAVKYHNNPVAAEHYPMSAALVNLASYGAHAVNGAGQPLPSEAGIEMIALTIAGLNLEQYHAAIRNAALKANVMADILLDNVA